MTRTNLLILLALCFKAQAFDPAKSIIGKDERTRVFNTLSRPFIHIGRVGQWCTGTLVSPDVVITAGHCVYANDDRKFVESSYFRQAQDGNSMAFEKVNFKSIHVLKKYDSNDYSDGDVALIKLSQKVEEYHYDVHFQIPSRPKSVRIAGYPKDKKKQMWSSTCEFKKAKTMIEYDCDTLGGMSGSVVHNFSKGVMTVYGIHVLGGELNSAVAITQDIIEGVNALKKNRTPNKSVWKNFKNPRTHFVPEYDEIILKNDSKYSKSKTVIYKNFDKEEVKRTVFVSGRDSKVAFKTRSSFFYVSFESKSCTTRSLKLIDGKCYKRISIISTNWGQMTLLLSDYQASYSKWN